MSQGLRTGIGPQDRLSSYGPTPLQGPLTWVLVPPPEDALGHGLVSKPHAIAK